MFLFQTLKESEISELPGEWLEVIGARKCIELISCDFGLGEGATVVMAFDDNSFEVGHGEALRPYNMLYSGNSERKAMTAFFKDIMEMMLFD